MNIDASEIEKFASSQAGGAGDLMLTNDEIDKYSAVMHYTVTSVTEKAPTVSAKIDESH